MIINFDKAFEGYRACCACIVVEYKPEELSGGMMREKWCCTSCGMEFVKSVKLKAICDKKAEELMEARELLRNVTHMPCNGMLLENIEEFLERMDAKIEIKVTDISEQALEKCKKSKSELLICNSKPASTVKYVDGAPPDNPYVYG